MKKVLLVLVILGLMASVSSAMIKSVYVNNGRIGVDLSGSEIGIEGSIPAYVSNAGTYTLGVRKQWTVGKPSKAIKTYGAVRGLLASANAPSTVTVTFLGGAEMKIAEKLTVFADITLISVNLAGATTFTALTSNAQIYTGGRLYL